MIKRSRILVIFILMLMPFFLHFTAVSAIESPIKVKNIYFKNEPIQYISNRIYLVIFSSEDYKGNITITYNFEGTVYYLFKDYPITIIANKEAGLFTDTTFLTSGKIPLSLTLSDSAKLEQQELEVFADTDKDTIPNVRDEDNDNDTIPDKIELINGTNPYNPDSDYDGILDNMDIFPNNSKENIDLDNDGIGDNEDSDDDNDGILDIDESKYGTNPRMKDTDNDGLSDFEEVIEKKTDPLNADTDKDGINDFNDPAPNDPTKTKDSDQDGISDEEEIKFGLNPNKKSDALEDSDNDGISNFDEIVNYFTDPNLQDSDNDSLSDEYEIDNELSPNDPKDSDDDPDEDGLTNKTEYSLRLNPHKKASIANINDSTIRLIFYIIPSIIIFYLAIFVYKKIKKTV